MKEYKSKKEFKEALKHMDAVEIYEEVLRGKYIKTFPKGFWEQPEAKDNSIKITKYMIEEKLKWNEEDIKEKLNTKIFKYNKLYSIIDTLYNSNIFNLMDSIYPDKFKPWEFKSVSNGYWQDDNNIKEAMKWLIEEKLKWDEEDIKEKFCADTLSENRLTSLQRNGIPYLINSIYPNKFKPWELNTVSKNYWNNEDNIKKAMKWLIEEKLKWNEEDIKEKYCVDIIINNNLSSLLRYKSLYELIDLVYPNKFKIIDFKYYYRYRKDK